MEGRNLSHYRILDEVGRGGMGIVYRAVDRKLKREVAIKILRADLVADEKRKRRFIQEAQAAAAIDHPHVASVHEIDEVEGVTFIAMEFIRGQVLRALIQNRGLPPRQVLDLAVEMAEGLARAHAQGIVHRDLKPANVMVTEDGHAKIIDFGLAKLLEPIEDIGGEETPLRHETESGRVLGTVAYMSPEQAHGEELDGRSDIFSLGVVIYEMLTSTTPFQGKSAAATLSAILKTPPPPLPSMSPDMTDEDATELQRILGKCLEKDLECRYQDVRELIADLRLLRRRVDTASFRAERSPASHEPKRLRWLLATCATLGLAIGATFFLNPPRPAVAVLPWDYSGPRESSNLSQMLPLALAERLRATTSLRVAPYAASQTYSLDEDVTEVAVALGVDWVVRGTINVTAGRLTSTLIISAPEGELEGSPKRMEGDLTDLNATADGIATSLAVALKSDPSSPASLAHDPEAFNHYLLARTFLEGWDVERNYEKAEQAFREALATEEGFAEAHAGLALAYWTRYRETREVELVTRAITEALRAVSLAPSLPEAHLALGIVQLGRGRSAEAAMAFERAQELAPEDDVVCRSIADAYSALERYQEAELLYQRAIDLRPGYWENYNFKGAFLLENGRYDEAKVSFREVIRLRPESATGYTNLAGAHLISGELEDAEPLLKAAIRIDPSAHQAHNNIGFVHYSLGQFEESAEAFRQAIRLSPEEATYHGGLGDATRQLGQAERARIAYARAVKLWKAALDVNPADGLVRAELSTGLAGLGQCVEARTQANLVAGNDSERPYLSYLLAISYALCKDEGAALEHMRQAVADGALVDVRSNPDLRRFLDHPSLRDLLQ